MILLRKSLKKLSEPPPSLKIADIIDYCYGMRGQQVNQIHKRSKRSQDDYERLAHHIGRLGATRSAARSVVKGMTEVPDLLQITSVQAVNAPDVRQVPTDRAAMSPYEIVRGICEETTLQNPMDCLAALLRIVELDLPFDNASLRARLNSQEAVVTRVHCELQIADKFSKGGLSFVGDDRYIGCSKPACYFCYSWLSNHQHGYVLPATHCKIILGCRGPDTGINESGVVFLKGMYAKVCARLGQDILGYLLEMKPLRRGYQYQSTEGSSYAQSGL